MKSAEVILPLGIEGTYTYAVPQALEARVQPLVRVIVPLGKSKTYVGIVADLRNCEDTELQSLKPIVDVLDEEPVLLPYQFKLWEWIADYYMSPLGDVYRAAFPLGMKQEERYKPRTETYIRLTEKYRNEQALHVALNMLVRSPRQLDVLNTYLALSHYDGIEGNVVPDDIVDITREELTNTVHCSAAMVKNVIDRGILETYEMVVGRLNTQGKPHPERIMSLSEAQQKAFEVITNYGITESRNHGITELRNSVNPQIRNSETPVLLWGVTGSGKTEIYIHLIQKAIDEGKQVLYLLPEIALTVQIMQRLHRIFGDRMGIYHSKYSDEERVEIWQKQLSDHPYDIILGARSAVFLPMQRLGLIIIDEEHEQSYKQQDPAPRYHARSVALMMARHFGCQTVLGTATPSIETFHNAMTGKYRLVKLTERYKGMQLPEIRVVDTADLQRRKMMRGMFSPQLLTAVNDAITNDRQAILFQNRRGFAPMVECHVCGWVPKCDNCDVSLTMHKVTNQLTCHYCGHTMQIPKQCPCCESHDIRVRGYGTEKVEETLEEIMNYGTTELRNYETPENRKSVNPQIRNTESPVLRIARMDLDTTRTKNAYERIINEFSAGKSNVLIGTQMVSKGLDFGRVNVVGILSADTMLNNPDFRAYEHAFQMMSQVAGRAGRKDQRGLVILQTRQPDLPVIDQVVRNDYEEFYRQQIEERQLFRYPPFTNIIYVYLRHAKEPLVESAAYAMNGRLRYLFGSRVLGPDRPPVARVKQLNIRKIVLKLERGIDLVRVRQYLRQVRNEIMQDKRYASLQVYYDVDPM